MMLHCSSEIPLLGLRLSCVIILCLLYPVFNFGFFSVLISLIIIGGISYAVSTSSHSPSDDFLGVFITIFIIGVLLYFFKTLANVVLFLSIILCTSIIFIQETVSYLLNTIINGNDIYNGDKKSLCLHFLSPILSIMSCLILFDYGAYKDLYNAKITIDTQTILSIIQNNLVKIAVDNQQNAHASLYSTGIELMAGLTSNQFELLSKVSGSVLCIVQAILLIYFIIAPLMKIFISRMW